MDEIFRLAGALVLLSGLSQVAIAAPIVDTSNDWDFATGVCCLQIKGVAGQVFTAPPTPSRLSTFSLWVDDYAFGNSPNFAALKGYLLNWDGEKVLGPPIYQSPQRLTSNNSGIGGWERIDFNIGGLELTAGAQYIMFLYMDNSPPESVGGAIVGMIPFDVYDGGEEAADFLRPLEDFSTLYERRWTTFPDHRDLAFVAEFSQFEVPEPTSRVLSALVLVIAIATGAPHRTRIAGTS